MGSLNYENLERSIKDYYSETYFDYTLIWGTDDHASMHYGYHDETTDGLGDAIINMDRHVAEKAGIDASDKILDAGCGVGGSSIRLASEYGGEVVGIDISDENLQKARGNARERDVDSVKFVEDNFLDTGFPDESFDVVWAIETVCHAENKSEFVEEAYRLLRDGGRLVVCDGYRSQDEVTGRDRERLDKFIEGMSVPNLANVEEFRRLLEETGFEEISYENHSENSMPSSKRMYATSILFYPINRIANVVGLRSDVQVRNVVAAYHQYPLLKKGVWEHGLFYAEK